MKRKIIVLLAVFFFLAISGLILIQLSWIRNAIAITDQQFRYMANRALESVVLDLEEKEIIKKIVDELEPASADSVTVIVAANSPFARKLQGYHPDARLVEKYGLSSSDEAIAITSSGHKIFISSESVIPYPSGEINEPSPQVIHSEITGRVSNKIIYLESLMEKILRNTPDIRDRVDPEDLQKRLRQALNNVEIYLDFEFSIRSGRLGTLWKTPGFTDKIGRASWRERV